MIDAHEFFFYNDSDDDSTDDLEHVDDEPDGCTEDLSDNEEEIGEPIALQNTINMKQRLAGEDIASKVRATLSFMKQQKINLPIFLEALSWGDSSCHSDPEIQYARTSLTVSKELAVILRRWYNPPRSPNQKKGKRPAGARRTLQEFAIECVGDLIDREMKSSAHLFLSPPEDLSEEQLTKLDFQKLKAQIICDAPIFWRLLRRAAYSEKQELRNKHKDPDMVTKVILNMVSQVQYTRSHQCGRLPKLWAIYLKACGLSARAFDAIHALGVTMSHKWAANAYGTLSELKMKEVRLAIEKRPWTISHDNVNLPLRVFSQRLHNKSHFVSGCAATVWVLPQQAALPLDANRLLQKHRAKNCGEIFPIEDILYGDKIVDDRIEAQHVYRILRILLDSPEFSNYLHHDSELLNPPPPVNKLPFGPDNITEEFILGTSDLEEASYDGTLKVKAELFRQLHLHTEKEEIRTGLERVIVWMGDQLTVERLRGLWKYRHEDFNSFDRMDYMIPAFGWFHLVMAFANSLHKQYLGTSAGIGGLRQAFDILKRKGLVTQSTKGPFWHHLDEAIHHISEAHFRATWLTVGKVKSMAELNKRPPHELRDLAEKIVREDACHEVLVRMDSLPVEQQDHVKRQWTMWNMDVLPYLELRDAIKHGDVGRMEDLLPTLLFRFAGGGNPKYTIEILELLQGLRREWPDDICKYIREWCWLMNQAGKEDSWFGFDLGQEENIADIKVNYHSMGPGAKMEYMHKVSPAIPTLRAVQRHIEKQFKTASRGARHGIPDKEKDVQMLMVQYVNSELHLYKAGRKIKVSADKSSDFVSLGADNLERLGTITEWFARRSHPHSTVEDWGPERELDSLL